MTAAILEREFVDPDEPAESEAPRDEALCDIAAEQVVLGSMMLDPAEVPDIAAMLTVDDFYRPGHGVVFAALVDLEIRGEPTDPVALAAYLSGRGLLVRAGGADYLHTLMAVVPVSTMAMHHAKIVAGKAILRRLLATTARIRQMVSSCAHDEAAAALDSARRMLAEIDAPSSEEGPVAWRDILPATLKSIDDDGQGVVPAGAIPTGIADLDRILGGGYRPGQLVIVAGRTGIGKTVHALDVARAAAFNRNPDDRKPIAVWSLEMSQDELARRLLSAQARVPLDVLNSGKLAEEDWVRIHRYASETEDAPLFLDTSVNLTVADIRARAIRIKRQHGLGCIVVDYLQLLTPAKGSGREGRQEQVAAMSRGLKLLAKELDVPVIAVSQLNRGPETRADKRPTKADLRESGAVENDANVIVLIFREDYYDKESPRAGEVDLIVDKNRNGPTDTITAAAQLHFARFVDMAV